MHYHFTLRVRLESNQLDADRLMHRLAEAGCQDALVGIGRLPRVALAFSREANCAQDAVATAFEQVRQALPGVRMVEVSRVAVHAHG